MKTEDELKEELASFQQYWHGGTSRAKMGWKESIRVSIFQDLEAIYKTCISPYIASYVTVLEIGADGGFWTQRMLNADRVFCFDVLSFEHTGFFKRIAPEITDSMPIKDNITYFQVKDFECKELDDYSIDYLFSYDTFCHISYSGAEAYLKNLYPKLKYGSNCFIMIADADKYDNQSGRIKLMETAGYNNFEAFVNDYDGCPVNGRWYFYGTERFCSLLDKYNYSLVSKDVAIDIDKLSPIVHFRKLKII